MITVLVGDAVTKLKALPDESVHCVVTSPPYWGLRDYKVDGQIGLEKTPEEYVSHLVEVFREVKRVLRKDGTLWLNLGDSYWSDTLARKEPVESMWGNRPASDLSNGRSAIPQNNRRGGLGKRPEGLKPKDLVGIPWRVAFALQADGWYLRSDIIWSKNNPMPESVRDRPTKSHEYIFLLTKSARYFFDQEAVRERQNWDGKSGTKNYRHGIDERIDAGMNSNGANPAGRNIRSVWEITTQPYPEAHFATFPEELPRRCIKAGTSEKGCCAECGACWEQVTVTTRIANPPANEPLSPGGNQDSDTLHRDGGGVYSQRRALGWQPTCSCGKDPVPCVVLDPFAGSGTTGAVARSLGRRAILIELNPEYAKLIDSRSEASVPDIMVFGETGKVVEG